MGWNFKKAKKSLIESGEIKSDDIILKGHHLVTKLFWHPGFLALADDRFTFVYTNVEDWAAIRKEDIKDFAIRQKGSKLFVDFVWLNHSDKKIALRLKLGDIEAEKVIAIFAKFKNN